MRTAVVLLPLAVGLSFPLVAYQNAPISGPVYTVGAGVSSPIPINRPEPRYTDDSRQRRVSGQVLLEVVVDQAGLPIDITIKKSLDAGLDQEALIAVRKWRFKPGMKDGMPVLTRVTIELTFNLR